MNTTPELGSNKTGIAMSPFDSTAMSDGSMAAAGNTPPGGAEKLNDLRADYIKEADPIGTVALPGTMKGVANTVIQKLKGDEPAVLLDKLGERLAFERTGVRLYDLFIAKCEANPAQAVALPLAQLREFQKQEAMHFAMLSAAIEALGADPTSVTPSGDMSGVLGLGVLQVLSDPRTTVAQSLEAILTIELIDNNAWESLIQLADQLGMRELATQMEQARAEEEEHLNVVRALTNTMLMDMAAS